MCRNTAEIFSQKGSDNQRDRLGTGQGAGFTYTSTYGLSCAGLPDDVSRFLGLVKGPRPSQTFSVNFGLRPFFSTLTLVWSVHGAPIVCYSAAKELRHGEACVSGSSQMLPRTDIHTEKGGESQQITLMQGSTGVVAWNFGCQWLKDWAPAAITSHLKGRPRSRMREHRFNGYDEFYQARSWTGKGRFVAKAMQRL